MARGLARDLGPRGITINIVQPGPTDTDMNPADGELAEQMHSVMAIKRHGTAQDVAHLTAYLPDHTRAALPVPCTRSMAASALEP